MTVKRLLRLHPRVVRRSMVFIKMARVRYLKTDSRPTRGEKEKCLTPTVKTTTKVNGHRGEKLKSQSKSNRKSQTKAARHAKSKVAEVQTSPCHARAQEASVTARKIISVRGGRLRKSWRRSDRSQCPLTQLLFRITKMSRRINLTTAADYRRRNKERKRKRCR